MEEDRPKKKKIEGIFPPKFPNNLCKVGRRVFLMGHFFLYPFFLIYIKMDSNQLSNFWCLNACQTNELMTHYVKYLSKNNKVK